MVNSILDAVTKQLGTTFGNKYRYYVEDVEQGLREPCFRVGILNPIIRSRSPVLYDRVVPITIHYFSDSEKDLKKDCYSIGEQTVECLEYLPFGNTLLRGEDISYDVQDDVLIVFMTYKFTTKRVEKNGEFMETLHETVSRVR